VVIVGGGTAGCATALSLVRSKPDATILILDDADPMSFKIGESLPADAKHILAYLSLEFLTQLSKDISNGLHKKCTGNASAWGAPWLEETYAMMNPFRMGYHLDCAKFDQSLRDAVASTLKSPSGVSKSIFTSVERQSNPEHWVISTRDLNSQEPKVFTACWVIDASGRKASLAHKLGANTVKSDSLLVFYALFVSPPTTQDRDYHTLIESSESGWWYSSQLPNNHCVVIYHTDDSDPSSRDTRKLDGFLNLLSHQTTYISALIADGEYDLVVDAKARQLRCTAARSSYLEPFLDAGDILKWCAVGDAAMAFDPLSSQGMITALKMGSLVSDVVAQDLHGTEGLDITSKITDVYSQVHSKYEKEKRYYYKQVMRFDGDFWRVRR
ncbi:hypothetical protein JAAARDRAFT_716233, partial [Jaapia argillacea MUCL 33604]